MTYYIEIKACIHSLRQQNSEQARPGCSHPPSMAPRAPLTFQSRDISLEGRAER